MLHLQKKTNKADAIFGVSSNFLFQNLRVCERKKCQTDEHTQFIIAYLKSMMVEGGRELHSMFPLSKV